VTYLIAAAVLVVAAYVILNLRWQVWDRERRHDRTITRLVRERVEQYRI
jgi:hypothetical protein